MNKFKLLVSIFSLCIPNLSFGEEDGLNYPDFKPASSLASINKVASEFKSIQTEIRLEADNNQQCSKQTLNSTKKHLTNRGLADEAHFYLGICKELSGDIAGAKEEYQSSLKLKKSNKEAIFRLAYLSCLTKDYKSTISLAEEATWMNYDKPTLPQYLKAFSFSMQNDLNEAKKALDLLEKIDNKFPPSLALRKKLLTEEINKTTDPSKKKALRDSYNLILPKLLAADPLNKTYSMEYAKILLAQGHPIQNPQALMQGIGIARKFSRISNNIDEPFLLLEIQYLEKQGKLNEAKSILDNLEGKSPLSPSIEYKRGELEKKLNPDAAPE